MTTNWRLWLLVALIIFLPLSAWLVSLTGSYLVSLGRDGLLGLFLLFSLPNWANYRRPNLIVWLGLVFIIFTLISYFVRQDSIAQWLRGVRYLIEPVVLLIALQINPLPNGWQRPLGRAIGVVLALVLLGGLIDYFFPSVLRLTVNATGSGYLGQIHYAATSIRLQSTLAGPNALGLFLASALILAPFWGRNWPRWLTNALVLLAVGALALTFSRSSFIGLAAGLIFYLILIRSQQSHAGRYLAATVVIVGLLMAGTLIFQPTGLTRFNSNDIRLEQYHRIWQERRQIGLFGRGAGTTGLVSEYSFDHSPNYFSENSYLDVYENIGLFGALAYLALWIWLIIFLIRQKTALAATVGATVLGLAIAGLFIDHYTGQAAIWLTLMFAGLVGDDSPVGPSAQRSSTSGGR